jgi:hypothetical protein
MLDLFFSLEGKEDRMQLMSSEPFSLATFINLLYFMSFLNTVRKMNHNVEVMPICVSVHPCAFHPKLPDS